MPSLNTGNAILSNPIKVDSSYNVGIGGAASGSFKLQVTGTTNLTGALSGTSATFLGKLTIGNSSLAEGEIGIFETGGNYNFTTFKNGLVRTIIGSQSSTSQGFLGTASNHDLLLKTNDTTRLTIASTGAATFSDSVTNKVTNISADGAGVVLQGYVDNSLRIAVRGSGYNSGARGGLLASTGDFSSSVSATQGTFTSNDTFAQDSSGQIVIRGASNTAKRLGIGFDTTNNYAYLQAIEAGVATRPLVLQPFGGNVGIGTSSPTGRLMVYGSSAGNIFTSLVSNQGGSTQVGINFAPSMTDSEFASNQAQASIYATDSNYGANIIFANKTTGAVSNSLTERMRITSGGRVGIENSAPQGKLEVGRTASNTTAGGHFFSTFIVPVNTWTTIFYAPNNNWNAITEFTWTSSGDYNRSGAAYMRWAYVSATNTLGVVYTLFNNDQNAAAQFRNSGGEIQIYITGGAVAYNVQVRIQGSQAA